MPLQLFVHFCSYAFVFSSHYTLDLVAELFYMVHGFGLENASSIFPSNLCEPSLFAYLPSLRSFATSSLIAFAIVTHRPAFVIIASRLVFDSDVYRLLPLPNVLTVAALTTSCCPLTSPFILSTSLPFSLFLEFISPSNSHGLTSVQRHTEVWQFKTRGAPHSNRTSIYGY